MMLANVPRSRSAPMGACALVVMVLGGCSRVKPEELSAELAKLRAEMRTEYTQGDQQVSSTLGSRMDGFDARLNELASDLTEMAQTFDVTVERMENAIRFQAPVHFGFDDATIRDSDRLVLDRFAAVIKSSYPGVLITAEGFTDPSGSAEYNRTLGLRRADAVIDYLVASGGIDETQMRAVSYGEDTKRLLDAQKGPGSAGLRNRRVVLVIEGPPGAAVVTDTEASQR